MRAIKWLSNNPNDFFSISFRFVINLLLTNLLSSFLLIPLLLVDQESTAPLSDPILATNTSTWPQNITEAIVEEEEDILINKSDIIIKTSEKIVTVTNYNAITPSTNESMYLLCYLAQSGTSLVCTASIFSILLIGINQYFAVIHSLRYHFYISKNRCMIYIYTGWLVAIFFGILGAVSQNHSGLWHFCDQTPKSSSSYRIINTVYAFVYFVFMILAPFLAISVIYCCIYTAAKQNSERMRRSTSGSCNLETTYQTRERVEERRASEETVDFVEKPLPKVQSAPNFLNLNCDSGGVKVTRTASDRAPNNFINSLKFKISNASVFRYREEARAAKISIIVIFMVLICYIPYGITLILNSDLINIKTPRYFNYVALVLLIVSNIISPFLFAYRNKRIQREVGKFLGLITDKNNKLSIKKKTTNSRIPRLMKIPDETAKETNTVDPGDFLLETSATVPEVVVTCKVENEKKSILKRVCSKNWTMSYKKCSFITVPDSCLGADNRGSFSSASTQISTEEWRGMGAVWRQRRVLVKIVANWCIFFVSVFLY